MRTGHRGPGRVFQPPVQRTGACKARPFYGYLAAPGEQFARLRVAGH